MYFVKRHELLGAVQKLILILLIIIIDSYLLQQSYYTYPLQLRLSAYS